MNCTYVFKRGVNKGKFCNKIAVSDNRCRLHVKNIHPNDCDKWLQNKSISPFTNRKISPTGKIYKSLKKICTGSPEISSSFDHLKKICNQWYQNKFKNPRTNRTIKQGGKVYKNLERECINISEGKSPRKSPRLPSRSPRRSPRKSPRRSPRRSPIKSPRKYKKKPKTKCPTHKSLKKQSAIISANKEVDVPKIIYVLKYKSVSYDVPEEIAGWILSHKLGSGGFGIVFECCRPNCPEKYAIKIEHESSVGLIIESNFYRNFSNKFIAKCYDMGVYKHFRYIVFEKLYEITNFYTALPQILKGLKFFADNNLSHGDVKFENLMQRANGDIVVNDMGMVSRLTYSPSSRNKTGTPLFMSIPSHDGIISKRNDLESLLFTILDMVDYLPWNGDYSGVQSLDKIRAKKIRFLKQIKTNNSLYEKFQLHRSKALAFFLYYVSELDYMQDPDYNKIIYYFSYIR